MLKPLTVTNDLHRNAIMLAIAAITIGLGDMFPNLAFGAYCFGLFGFSLIIDRLRWHYRDVLLEGELIDRIYDKSLSVIEINNTVLKDCVEHIARSRSKAPDILDPKQAVALPSNPTRLEVVMADYRDDLTYFHDTLEKLRKINDTTETVKEAYLKKINAII